MIGARFERLTVVEQAGTRAKKRLWRCRCDCGGLAVTTTGDLRSGTTRSCGCLQRERTALGKWLAQVKVDGRNHSLGLFADVEDAARAASEFRAERLPFSVEPEWRAA